MVGTLRLFIGIQVGEAWTEVLRAAAGRLAGSVWQGGRWVRPELYHVTVVFLGSQSPESVPTINAALAEAAGPLQPFSLRLREIQRLGGRESGALVAAVDDPSSGLQVYRARLDAALRRHGMHFDAKPLVPHVTLVRPKRGVGSLPLTPVDLRTAPPLNVQEVALVKSDLLPSGPRYEAISTVQLGR